MFFFFFFINFKINLINFQRSTLLSFLSWSLPLFFIFYFYKRMSGGMANRGGGGGPGGIFGMSQSKARILKENTGVTFK